MFITSRYVSMNIEPLKIWEKFQVNGRKKEKITGYTYELIVFVYYYPLFTYFSFCLFVCFLDRYMNLECIRFLPSFLPKCWKEPMLSNINTKTNLKGDAIETAAG